ncbi:MAG: HigA family addiction module antitoxin [Pigmentiphaga sp.]|nr:HigA family addiction module antitoxin [Pigmentiphaga sp.]
MPRRQRPRSGLRGLSLMTMHNPPHPGEFITGIYLEPYGISGRELAQKLDVAPSTLSRLLKGSSRVTPEMALRLSKALGRTPESWLAMQDAHDLWIARQQLDLQRVARLELEPA